MRGSRRGLLVRSLLPFSGKIRALLGYVLLWRLRDEACFEGVTSRTYVLLPKLSFDVLASYEYQSKLAVYTWPTFS